jgi:histidinol-phosphate aminotransferase
MTHSKLSRSRRRFLAVTGIGTAWGGICSQLAALEPQSRLSPQPAVRPPAGRPTGLVKIDSNENPYGPSEKAFLAIQAQFGQSGRYANNTSELYQALRNHHQVEGGMVDVGYGSSEILKMAVEAFLGPGKNVVLAQPTYEAMARYGSVYGASAIRVPLDPQYRHDLKKMRAAVTDKTGLVYICNPNNPTATVVSGEALRSFVESMPPEIPVLIDEAYYHYVDDPGYSSGIPLAKQGKAVIVTRTFSKIYGMAGLRLGYAIAREDLIGKMSAYKIWLNTNVLTVAAALASLDDKEFVARNRKLNADSRRYVEQQVKQMGLDYIPSQANFLMVDLKRDMSSVAGALRSRNVYAGRPFYPLTNHLRVTIGTAAEMNRFVEELRAVLART